MSTQPAGTGNVGSQPVTCPVDPVAHGRAPAHERSDLDRKMLRLLRLQADAPKATSEQARKAFQTSLLVATVRCTLMYIVFPFVLPVIGVAKGVGPVIGLIISVIAITAIVMSIRRFWRADHSKRWHYTIFGTIVIGFLVYLAVKDISTLLR